jgi:hypothetical protein
MEETQMAYSAEENEVYTGNLVRETDKAKLINFGDEEPVWVPKSLIDSEEPNPRGGVNYTLPTWWAIENGLE